MHCPSLISVMDRAFRNIVMRFGRSVVEAGLMCAATPARQLGFEDAGRIVVGAVADLVVLDRDFGVVRTVIDGEEVFARES